MNEIYTDSRAPDNPRVLSIDLETYSSTDLSKCGVYRYVEADDFEILLLAYAFDEGEVRIVDMACGEKVPQEIWDAIDDPGIIKAAWNAQFERTCIGRYLGRILSPDSWQCSMIHAASLSLPLALRNAALVLKTGEQKDRAGENLIKYFSMPCKPTKSNGGRTRNLPEHDPQGWRKFKDYCLQDVRTERDIRRRLAVFPMPDAEWDYYHMDQRINDRGVRIDTVLVQQAIACDLMLSDGMTKKAYELTGLENPNSVSQLKQWLEEKGIPMESLGKKDVAAMITELDKNGCDQEALDMLKLRLQMAKSSVKKYQAAERYVNRDGRAKGLFQFYGANRTGRFSGRGIQLQNLPQNHISTLDEARELVKTGCFEAVEMLYGNTPDVLSQLIRTAFIPSEGARFIVADYSAIEARVLAWIAGEKWVLEEFRGDGLIYEATASMMFHVPKMEIKKGGPHADLRPKGKVATLACGYQGSKGALINMGALESGIPEEDLPGIVQSWRRANPHIVKFWYDVEAAAASAIEGKPKMLAHGLKFWCEKGYLFIQIPSRRRLAYYKPELEPDPEHNKMAISYMGTSQQSKAFLRRRTYGGMLTENIVQATARDCLRDAMRALWAAGYEIVFTVHDEVIIDAPVGFGSLDDVLEIMGRPLRWAPGLPLRAAGFETNFYMKD